MGHRFLIPNLVLCFFMLSEACYGGVLFSSLPQTLLVSASPKPGQVLRAGEDSIRVSWRLNQRSTSAANKESYKNIKAFLCYAPLSQVDRPWRKTVGDLSKDKTCQFSVFNMPYSSSMSNQSVEWLIAEDTPTAVFFVRVYAYDSSGREVAYGQTSDANKTSNLFEIKGISGIHWQLYIFSVCGCAFPLLSLLGVSLFERNKSKGVPKS